LRCICSLILCATMLWVSIPMPIIFQIAAPWLLGANLPASCNQPIYQS
jgi:hypothetical protein